MESWVGPGNKAMDRHYKEKLLGCRFGPGPLLPSVYLHRHDVIYVMKSPTLFLSVFAYYRSLTKKHLWPEHLTSLPKRVVGTLSSVSAFDRERAPMYAYGITLEILDEQWSHLPWKLKS